MADRMLNQKVYFIQAGDGGPIKIGVADGPGRRLRQMQTGSPEALALLKVLPGGVAREKAIHSHLADHRVRGEWFRPTLEVCALAYPSEMFRTAFEMEQFAADSIQLQSAIAARMAGA